MSEHHHTDSGHAHDHEEHAHGDAHATAPAHHAHLPSKQKLLLLAGLAIILMAVSGYGLWRNNQGQTGTGAVEITLTEDGFRPETITIPAGTRVTFKSTRSEFYWPASDLHPSHGIYPAFDPKEPVAGTDTWSFTFDKPGTWKYHDHISPYYTGTITVTESR